MKRILITGASGFLGWNLAKTLRRDYHVCGTFMRNPVAVEGCRMERIDLTSEEDLRRLAEQFAPEVILHPAAVIDVDLCERERELAERINAAGTRMVAARAAAAGARLIYFSTDMVFDGEKGMYREDDPPHPINWYGATKLAGERWALSLAPQAVVARVSLMYGQGNAAHGSFLGWMRRKLAAGERVDLFIDQYRTPTFVGDVCRAVRRILELPGARGIYHLAGPERINRYDFGRRMAEIFNFPAGLLRPVRMADLKKMMPRPKDNSLDNRKAHSDLGIEFLAVGEGLRAAAEEWDTSRDRGAGLKCA